MASQRWLYVLKIQQARQRSLRQQLLRPPFPRRCLANRRKRILATPSRLSERDMLVLQI